MGGGEREREGEGGREGEREREREKADKGISLSLASVPPPPLLPSLTLSQKKKKTANPTFQAGVIATVRTAVTLGRDDPGREAAVAAVRTATNSWVAKYRRDNQFSGKPSYG